VIIKFLTALKLHHYTT